MWESYGIENVFVFYLWSHLFFYFVITQFWGLFWYDYFNRERSAFTFIHSNTGSWIGLMNSWSFTTEDPVAYIGSEVYLSCSRLNSGQ